MVLFNLTNGLSWGFLAWCLPTNSQHLRNDRNEAYCLSISVCLSFFYSFPNCCCGCTADMPKLVICGLDLEKKHVHLTPLATHKYTHSNTNRSDYFWSESFCSQWQQGCILRICMADAVWLGNRKQWITWRLCPQPSDTGTALSPREWQPQQHCLVSDAGKQKH